MTSFGSKGTQSTSLLSPQLWVIPLLRACLYGKPAAVVPALDTFVRPNAPSFTGVRSHLMSRWSKQAPPGWQGLLGSMSTPPGYVQVAVLKGRAGSSGQGRSALWPSPGLVEQREGSVEHTAWRTALPLLPAHTKASLPSLISTGRFQGTTGTTEGLNPSWGAMGWSELWDLPASGWPHHKMLCTNTCHSVQELRDRGHVVWQS